MKKLIELDAAIKATWKDTGYTDPLNVMTAIRDRIEALPPVDAVPVVHGRWIDETFTPWGLMHHPYKCDQCGDHSEAPSNYCPNCGAIMDGGHYD